MIGLTGEVGPYVPIAYWLALYFEKLTRLGVSCYTELLTSSRFIRLFCLRWARADCTLAAFILNLGSFS